MPARSAQTAAKPRTILLVEDSEDDALLFLLALRKSGIKARAHRVENGLVAIAYLERVRDTRLWPDVIMLDWNMPEMDGSTFMRWFHKQTFERTPAIIALTATEEPHHLRNIMAFGVTHWIKPVTTQKLCCMA